MNILVFDTETTGKAEFRLPPEHPSQPRVVQLAALLIDEAGEEQAALNLIVRQSEGIPKEAADIHGITTEIANQFGVPLLHALEPFGSLVKQAGLLVAHNIAFDHLVMTGEFGRMCVPFEIRPSFCTMTAMTDICKLPGNYGKYKWPKLQEAHKHAFGAEFEGAHDAMADVRACARLYRWLKERDLVPQSK